jgi:hypothetical protein
MYIVKSKEVVLVVNGLRPRSVMYPPVVISSFPIPEKVKNR